MMCDKDHDLVPQKHAPDMQLLAVCVADEILVLENATVRTARFLCLDNFPSGVRSSRLSGALGFDDFCGTGRVLWQHRFRFVKVQATHQLPNDAVHTFMLESLYNASARKAQTARR